MRTVIDEAGGSTSAPVTTPIKRGRGRPRKQETIQLQIDRAEQKAKRRPRFVLPEMQYLKRGEDKTITFPLDAEFIAEPESNKDRDWVKKNGKVYHLLPRIWDYPNREIPDSVNPRSHETGSLKHPVARDIENTLRTNAVNFHLINRGITVLAEHLTVKDGQVHIEISNPKFHGTCDGATTDAVIYRVKHELKKAMELEKDTVDFLNDGRVYIRVIVGISDHEKIEAIASGLNTSKQVRSWSLAGFKGQFKFLQDVIDSETSPFKNKVGWDENDEKDVSALDILSYLTLFHPEWDKEATDELSVNKGPVIAYSSKGKLVDRLDNAVLLEGYKTLQPVILDVLRLHDHIYSTFGKQYEIMRKGEAKLGRRIGFDRQPVNEPYILPLTGSPSNYKIDNGIIYPLLGSLRPLIKYRRADGLADWRENPFKFYDANAPRLIAHLMDLLENEGNSPNKLAKSRIAYTSLAREVQFLISKRFAPKED